MGAVLFTPFIVPFNRITTLVGSCDHDVVSRVVETQAVGLVPPEEKAALTDIVFDNLSPAKRKRAEYRRAFEHYCGCFGQQLTSEFGNIHELREFDNATESLDLPVAFSALLARCPLGLFNDVCPDGHRVGHWASQEIPLFADRLKPLKGDGYYADAAIEWCSLVNQTEETILVGFGF
ncbi:MAG: hypothetical protein AAFU85_31300 [Planctomycetota bacterium]